jgi:NAD(P)H-nitrite reductase large subunit
VAEEHFVVIGNGPCGHEAAITLRERAPLARITIIGKENEPSYQPHLLPGYLAGTLTEDALYISSYEYYKKNDIKFRCGQEVVHLDPDEHYVILDHKEKIPLTGAVIAAGGAARIPESFWSVRESLKTLKTIGDAKQWIRILPTIESILIIGGDLTSFGFTRALLQLGKRVHFILSERSFWPLRCNERLYDEVKDKLLEMGVDVVSSRHIQGITQIPENRYRVHVDGKELVVELIGAFFGLVPDVGFLQRSGLTLDRGILVDEYLNTGHEAIYAAGDCAQIYHPAIRDYWVSIGHENAKALGRIAAINLVGGRVRAEVASESIYEVEGIRVNTSWWMDF